MISGKILTMNSEFSLCDLLCIETERSCDNIKSVSSCSSVTSRMEFQLHHKPRFLHLLYYVSVVGVLIDNIDYVTGIGNSSRE